MRSYSILAVAASVAVPALVSAVPIHQGSDALSTGRHFRTGLISNSHQNWEANRGKRSDDEFSELLARETATGEPQTQHVTPESEPKTHGHNAGAHPHEHAGAVDHEGAKHGAAHSHLHAGQHAGKHAHRHEKSDKGTQGRRKGLHAQKGESAAQKGEHAAHHSGVHSSEHSASAHGHSDAAEHPATHHTKASTGTGASAERPLETQTAAPHQRRGREGGGGHVSHGGNGGQHGHGAFDSSRHHRRGREGGGGHVSHGGNGGSHRHGAYDSSRHHRRGREGGGGGGHVSHGGNGGQYGHSTKQHHRRGKVHKTSKALGLAGDAANAASSVHGAWQSFHSREDSPYDFLYERDYELDELE
ncbi:uncharacterized protein B0H18DRAFT_144032 [Fomitopsis serialis]|uniref:uncharacterized protein n=1 Tax=Fomitopsis serialis TaxID=139415 RepID=UPI0020083243|nr:uncharacterized protein B0H18DRAFT_144032 [Neoantrodia serialis]KAH9930237.1 hypothetical protein B0H18DRAFT_144032 [Neoantrodia serialis]